MVTPIGPKVLIRPEEVKAGKLLLPGAKPSTFHVLAVGDEVTKVKPGDVIFLEKHYGAEIEHDGVKYLVVDQETILAKL